MFEVGTPLFVMTALLAVAGAVTAAVARLGQGRAVLVASARAAAQLAAVALVITQVATRGWATALFLVVMYAVASWTARSRLDRLWWAPLPLAGGVLPVAGLLVVTGLVPMGGLVLIPMAGIVLGGAMTATTLCGRRCLDVLRDRRGEVEAALALGFTDRQAVLEICRPAAATALFPALDQTRTVGLVTLPGAFVGSLLGGATPAQAAIVQLVVLIAVLTAETIAVALTLELLALPPRFRVLRG